MKFKITNTKYEDSIVLEGETIEEIREEAANQTAIRGWKGEDCFSEKLAP